MAWECMECSDDSEARSHLPARTYFEHWATAVAASPSPPLLVCPVSCAPQVLKGFKNSTLGREQEVFACMVHNLFDEYRFFPKYPDKELATTGALPYCAWLSFR